MSIEVGTKVDGKVSGITNFGAFVDLGEHRSGLVHISEVSDSFVKDIHSVLKVGDSVTVKVLSIADDGKIALSIRKAVERSAQAAPKKSHEYHHSRDDRQFNHQSNHQAKQHHSNANESFDQMLSGFLKDSESRLSMLKKNTDGKRGGRGGRRN